MSTSKYAPFREFLRSLKVREMRMTFQEIEEILGFGLPPSSKYNALWANSGSSWPLAKIWLEEGWRVRDVSPERGRVTFYRNGEVSEDTLFADTNIVRITSLSPVAQGVLAVLARRSGRSTADEALSILNDALKA
jgi:hypothetical protein